MLLATILLALVQDAPPELPDGEYRLTARLGLPEG